MKVDKRLFLSCIACLGLVHCTQPRVDSENSSFFEDFRTVLTARAVLPPATLAEGPRSGQYIGRNVINHQSVPFNSQPVQGISAILDNNDGTFLAMSDNGFGSQENSVDYHLRVYTFHPDFETRQGGEGRINIDGFIELHDPDKHIPFPIAYEFTETRILTGADFDIESMQRAPDGTFWFGDEFGPYLLHTDAQGKLLEAPVPLPDFDNPGQLLQSPQNPYRSGSAFLRMMNAARQHGAQHQMRYPQLILPNHELLKLNETDSDGLFSLKSLHQAGFQLVPWAVNDEKQMLELMAHGVSGIITDRPDLLLTALQAFDANADGIPGDYLTEEGWVKAGGFDAQGHQGARDLRPENTLPAMEAALDYLMTTLALGVGVAQDGQPILNHAPYIEPEKCRRTDGMDYSTPALIASLTTEDIQQTFICDKLLRGETQRNDLNLSPVTQAFAKQHKLPHPYLMPTLAQVFKFVEFYRHYYQAGAGKSHAEAAVRSGNAAKIRFNIETRIDPRKDKDQYGNVRNTRTANMESLVEAVAELVKKHNKTHWSSIQSFDLRALFYIQEHYPAIRTAYLFDKPSFTADANGFSPWLNGMNWPKLANYPARVKSSGGFEGMAMTPDGKKLLPMLEKSLIDASADDLRTIYEFDIEQRRYTGVSYQYQMRPRAESIGEFILYTENRGLVIERDNSQADLKGIKQVFRLELGKSGEIVQKFMLTNLLDIYDPALLGLPVNPLKVVGIDQGIFAMPFVTIESIALLKDGRLAVVNDNNYPFSIGRHVGDGNPDETEFVLLKLPDSLRRELGVDFTIDSKE